jgi:hypothetical protein
MESLGKRFLIEEPREQATYVTEKPWLSTSMKPSRAETRSDGMLHSFYFIFAIPEFMETRAGGNKVCECCFYDVFVITSLTCRLYQRAQRFKAT